jgi:hypothetical protein
MGEKRSDHPDNEARERARKELELDITIPDYATRIVVGEATASHRMGTATEAIMAHLSLDLHLLEPCAAESGAVFGRERLAASG